LRETKINSINIFELKRNSNIDQYMLHLVRIQILFNSNELISLFTKGVEVGGGVRDKKRFALYRCN